MLGRDLLDACVVQARSCAPDGRLTVVYLHCRHVVKPIEAFRYIMQGGSQRENACGMGLTIFLLSD
jgi:hypothetical protein